MFGLSSILPPHRLPSPLPYDYGDLDPIRYGVSVEREPTPEEYQRLDDAAIHGDLDTVISIFEAERLPNTPMERLNNDKFTRVMHRAILNRQVPVVTYLLSQGVPFETLQVELAIEKGLHSLLPVFLDNGWNINTPRISTQPPLLAFVLDNRQLTEWFLSHGADPNAQCLFDRTPLTYAVRSWPLETIELLFEHGGSVQKGELLHQAVRRTKPDCLQVAQMLLDKGASINSIEYQHHNSSYEHFGIFGLATPLYNAADCGNVAMAELLLRNGADPLIPINMAAMVEFMLKNSAGPPIIDSVPRFPIDIAKERGHTAVVELLRPYSVSSSAVSEYKPKK